jgi:hypothetical protein
VRQLCNGGLQGALLGEGANVHFIDDKLQEGSMTKPAARGTGAPPQATWVRAAQAGYAEPAKQILFRIYRHICSSVHDEKCLCTTFVRSQH